MRGAPQSHRRGRRPGKPPSRWGQPVPHITDAVLSPAAFMKAVASTEDRRTFDRIVGNTAQSQHPTFQLRTSTGNDAPSIPHEAMLGNSSTPRGQTRERSSASMQATIEDTSKFMNAARAMTENRRQLENLPEQVDLPVTQPQRYDIATLKHWQPANGGTTLAIAKDAGLRMRALLSPEDKSPLDRPPVKTEHANMPHALKDPLYQVHTADHGDAGDDGEVREPAIPHSARPSQPVHADAAEVKDNIELVTANTPPTTVRQRINVDLLCSNENLVPTVAGEDMAKVHIPYRPSLPGTGNARTSTGSNTPPQSQDVIPNGGMSTGGERTFNNEEWGTVANGNNLVNDKAKDDEATERIFVVNHTTPDDSHKIGSVPEVTVNERANAEDEQRLSRANSGTGAKAEEEDSFTTAGAAEGNLAGYQLPTEVGVPEKDTDPGEEMSKEHVPVDHFRWLLPTNFQ